MTKLAFQRYFSGLSSNTFLLALASLFADISTEMLYPVLPIFLTQVLNASGSVVGLVEGIAEATQNIVQGLSGSIDPSGNLVELFHLVEKSCQIDRLSDVASRRLSSGAESSSVLIRFSGYYTACSGGLPHECIGCRLAVFSLLALAALDRGGCVLHRILCPPFRLSEFLRAHFARN